MSRRDRPLAPSGRLILTLTLLLTILLVPDPAPARAAPGDLDPSFAPVLLNGGSAAGVYDMALQADGKLVIVGSFTTVRSSSRWFVARLNPDGSVDRTFQPGFIDGEVRQVAIQPDSKLVIAGSFTSIDFSSRAGLARLNSDGSLDTSFEPGGGASGPILALAVQPGNRLVIGGSFSSVRGAARTNLARLNENGSLDTSFSPAIDGAVNDIALDSSGQLLIGGSFGLVNGALRRGLARLNSDGSLDTGFGAGEGAGGDVYALAVQRDGRLLVGGSFTSYDGTPRNNLIRLSSSGALDTTFVTGSGPDDEVRAIALQADDRVLVGGRFTAVDGAPAPRIARLSPTGALDGAFASVPSPVTALVVQADGRVTAAGLDGHIGRFRADGSRDPAFDLLLTRGGRTPSVSDLELAPDGGILIAGSFSNVDGWPVSNAAALTHRGEVVATALGNPNNTVADLALQPDGKLLMGGFFKTVSGITRTLVARLNADGSLDPAFGPTIEGQAVAAVVPQADGKILVGGWITGVGGADRLGLARLNADGSLDDGFAPELTGSFGPPAVAKIIAQPDGRVLVSGSFMTVNGAHRLGLARLNADGSLDDGFVPPAGRTAGGALALQPDGKVLVAGTITQSGTERRLVRLRADGSLDDGFNLDGGTSPDLRVASLLVQPDGKILVGTATGAGLAAPGELVLRLNPDGSLDQSFNIGDGEQGAVQAMALQPSGQLVIGGPFGRINSQERFALARLEAAAPGKVNLLGNGVAIPDGDTTPSDADGTDFGSSFIQEPRTATFTISNTGVMTLALASPAVTVADPGFADFTVVRQPERSVVSGGSTTFQLRFQPFTSGPLTATVSIVGADPDQPPFSFVVRGAGVAPAVSVRVSPASVAEDGGTPVVFTLTREGGTASALAVDVTLGGTATSRDYTVAGATSLTGTQGVVTIPAGASSASLSVTPIRDSLVERDETVVVTVVSPSAGQYVAGEAASAAATIAGAHQLHYLPLVRQP